MCLLDRYSSLCSFTKACLAFVVCNILFQLSINAQAPSPQKTDDRKEIEIINSNTMSYTNTSTGEVRFLNGDVKIRHEKTYMECDSAVIFMNTRIVHAFGHVYINNNDSLDIYCDMAKYTGTDKLVGLYSHVIMLNGKLRLESPEVFYDINTSIGNYYKGGTVINEATKIVSKKGTYYSRSSDVYFQNQVLVTDPKFKMTTDTLQYNTNDDLATFYSKTTIVGDNSTIYCYSGHYDTKKQLADFGFNTIIDNKTQQLYTDSLFYDRNNGVAKTYKQFLFKDLENKVNMQGTKAVYREENKYLFAWQRPLLINFDEKDSLFMKADTIISFAQDSSDKRFFYGYRHVKMYKKDLQAKCDSIYYSYVDSSFKMFYQPVLWSEDMQITGDTIILLTKDNKADELRVHGNGFISMLSSRSYFDQLKGNRITGYLKNNAIETMNIDGNAESIYFIKDDGTNNLIGSNKASSTKMKLFFLEKKIEKVKFMGKPEATFTPMKQLTDELKTLKGFSWQDAIRPKSKEDL
jgi:lipopolysaccharide export system protein LptA